jgi:tRNA threonylcarbamoyladenosine modification (KEOPS) complex  Pcc1 subunit
MSAGLYTLTIEQGATLSLVLTYRDSSANLVNLTGYTARMALRSTFDATSTILSLTTENSRISLGGSAGTITLTVAAADTAALTAPQSGVYDLELVSGSAVVTRLIQGTFNVTPEATR